MNERLNIQNIATQLAAETDKDKKACEMFLRSLVQTVSTALSEEKSVKIKGIGTFKVFLVEKRESVLVNTDKRFVIPEHYKFSFLPDKEMKDTINQPFSAFETTEITNDALFADMDSKPTEVEKAEDDEDEASEELFSIPEEPKTPQPAPAAEETQPEEQIVEDQSQIEQTSVPQETSDTIHINNVTEPLPPPSEPEVNPYRSRQETQSVVPDAIPDDKERVDKQDHLQSIQSQLLSQEHHFLRMRTWFVIISVLFAMTVGAGVFCCIGLYNQNRQLWNMLVPVVTQRSPSRAVIAPVDSVAPTDTVRSSDTTLQKKAVSPVTEPEVVGEETIRTGINLARLAKKYYGNSVFWVYLYQYNKEKIGDPNNVPIGTTIKVPSKGHYHIDAESKESVRAASVLQTQILTKYQ